MAECGSLLVSDGGGNGEGGAAGTPIERIRRYVSNNPQKAAAVAGVGVLGFMLVNSDTPTRKRLPSRFLRGGLRA
mgnify:CR=1 FL=1|jgi:hypothetical protein